MICNVSKPLVVEGGVKKTIELMKRPYGSRFFTGLERVGKVQYETNVDFGVYMCLLHHSKRFRVHAN